MFWLNCANVVFSVLKMQWFWNHLCGSQNTVLIRNKHLRLALLVCAKKRIMEITSLSGGSYFENYLFQWRTVMLLTRVKHLF